MGHMQDVLAACDGHHGIEGGGVSSASSGGLEEKWYYVGLALPAESQADENNTCTLLKKRTDLEMTRFSPLLIHVV